MCPVCGGEQFVLGTLGYKLYLRCRDCGIQTMQDIPKEDELTDEEWDTAEAQRKTEWLGEMKTLKGK